MRLGAFERASLGGGSPQGLPAIVRQGLHRSGFGGSPDVRLGSGGDTVAIDKSSWRPPPMDAMTMLLFAVATLLTLDLVAAQLR